MFWIIFFMFERGGVFTPDHVGIRSNPKVLYSYPFMEFSLTQKEKNLSIDERIGMYAVQLGIGGVVSAFITYFSTHREKTINQDKILWTDYGKGAIPYYFLGEIVFSNLVVWGIGKLLNKENFWKCTLGTLIGAGIGSLVLYKEYAYKKDYYIGVIIFAPVIGGIIGNSL